MMPHPHTICETAAMDHQARQVRATQDRLSAQAVRLRSPGLAIARTALRRLGGVLVRVVARRDGTRTGGTATPAAPAASVASLGPAR